MNNISDTGSVTTVSHVTLTSQVDGDMPLSSGSDQLERSQYCMFADEMEVNGPERGHDECLALGKIPPLFTSYDRWNTGPNETNGLRVV